MLHVPYKSSPPALNDVIGGRITMMFIDVLTGLPHVNGRRAAGAGRHHQGPLAADAGPAVDAGSRRTDFDITSWQGYFGPAGLPKEVVTRLNAEIRKIVENPEIKSKARRRLAWTRSPARRNSSTRLSPISWCCGRSWSTNAGIEKQ